MVCVGFGGRLKAKKGANWITNELARIKVGITTSDYALASLLGSGESPVCPLIVKGLNYFPYYLTYGQTFVVTHVTSGVTIRHVRASSLANRAPAMPNTG
jgi:hypothetical protein